MDVYMVFLMILDNLSKAGFGLLLLVIAYAANVLFSTWRNVNVLGEKYDPDRLKAGGAKLLCFGAGLVLLCVVVTTLPIFADVVGWAIPDEYKDAFSALVIVGLFLLAACKYALEAFNAMKDILFPVSGGEGA